MDGECVCDGTVPSKALDRAGLMDQTPKEQPVPGKVLLQDTSMDGPGRKPGEKT